MENEFTVTNKVSYNDLWDAVWGSDGAGMTYWASEVQKPNGDAIQLYKYVSNPNGSKDVIPNPQDFRVWDDYEERWHQVTLEDLANGYRLACETKAMHCGGCRVDDLEDPDACTGDVIIQLAIFKEVVYG